ncbi:MAG: hypothetical protein LUF91_01195 [Oscillospiraceae bacterium]|nr:hypothetical protein [Oscillospiraceae bacterium]
MPRARRGAAGAAAHGADGKTERMLLRRRVNLLVEMAAETASTARYLRDYYGRRTWKR